MANKILVVDGNYTLHRAFSVSAKTRNIEHLVKNTLTLFLQFVCNDALALRATHILVVFDSKRSFRHDLFKDYKATRNKGSNEVVTSTGDTIVLSITAGSLVSKAKVVCELAGLPVAKKKGYEGDDLLGSAASSLPGRVIVSTRDKDAAQTVTEDGRVTLYWPSEKVHLGWKDVVKKFGVKPTQIPEYLALMGDSVDNIPGVPEVGHKTAVKWLAQYDSVLDAYRADEKIKAKLKKHKDLFLLCRKLTTFRSDVTFKIEDLVPQKIDPDLGNHVWKIPDALKDLSDARKYSAKKGLFRK
jgi:DNA polymerase-1